MDIRAIAKQAIEDKRHNDADLRLDLFRNTKVRLGKILGFTVDSIEMREFLSVVKEDTEKLTLEIQGLTFWVSIVNFNAGHCSIHLLPPDNWPEFGSPLTLEQRIKNRSVSINTLEQLGELIECFEPEYL